MKNIAIITGATGGIGREFTQYIVKLGEVDEVWAIARNETKLAKLKEELGSKIIPLSKDLAHTEAVREIETKLKEADVCVRYLVNNAGLAKMGSFEDFTLEEIEQTIMINCTAMMTLTTVCIPFMNEGSSILNVSSAASFQPLPYLNLYSASKVFERYYSRALNVELKKKRISSMAVCPSWVDTDLLDKEIHGEPVQFDSLVSTKQVVTQAMKDLKKGKDISVCTTYVKYQHLLTKIFSQKTCMKTWLKKIKRYL